MRQKPQHRTLFALTFAALVLRVLVPAGLMPNAVADNGWYLSICPDGLPAQLAHKLLGHAHHMDKPGSELVQCDLGAGFGQAVAASGDSVQVDSNTAVVLFFADTLIAPRVTRFPSYVPRAPPVS